MCERGRVLLLSRNRSEIVLVLELELVLDLFRRAIEATLDHS